MFGTAYLISENFRAQTLCKSWKMSVVKINLCRFDELHLVDFWLWIRQCKVDFFVFVQKELTDWIINLHVFSFVIFPFYPPCSAHFVRSTYIHLVSFISFFPAFFLLVLVLNSTIFDSVKKLTLNWSNQAIGNELKWNAWRRKRSKRWEPKWITRTITENDGVDLEFREAHQAWDLVGDKATQWARQS